MTAVLLALSSALGYGASDFLAGLASRRLPYVRVAVVVQCVGVVVVLAALPFAGGAFLWDAALWGGLSGFGAGAGAVALYRGLARGQMSVAGPISGVGAAAIPALAGFALGERPSPTAFAGVVLAFPAVWLIARGEGGAGQSARGGAIEGVLAGVGFGLLFLALAQAPAGSGLWPSAASVLISAATVGLFSLVTTRGPWQLGAYRRAWSGVVAAGAVGAAGPVLYLLASRQGLLVVVGVLAALYPGVTVLLARVVLAERSGRGQILGLVLAAAAVVAIIVG